MGKVAFINQHDRVAVQATFPDRRKANVSWSRAGASVTLIPDDAAQAITLSAIVLEAEMKGKEPNYPFPTIGDVASAMNEVAKQAQTLEGYLNGLKATLQVTGEPPKAKDAASAPATTAATLAKSRGGSVITAHLPSGERATFTINRASVGFDLSPRLVSIEESMRALAFGIITMRQMSNETLANHALATARASASAAEWAQNFRARLTATS